MLAQNIPLAIGLVLTSSLCFAAAGVLQHGAISAHMTPDRARTGTTGDRAASLLGWRALWRSIRSPRWLAGMGLLGASAVLQVLALAKAPVTVVQPVGLLAFPWAVLLQAWVLRRPLRTRVGLAVAGTVASTGAFTLIGAAHAVPAGDISLHRILLGAGMVYLLTMLAGTLGVKGPRQWRCLAWASGGAMFYGLEAALVRSLIGYVGGHDWVHSTMFWIVVAVLVAGSLTAGWMIQQGYAAGPAEVVVGSTTITSPVIAVGYGMIVLGEGQLLTFSAELGMVVCAALALAGVVALARMEQGWTGPRSLS